jgi:hypothetical protein
MLAYLGAMMGAMIDNMRQYILEFALMSVAL